MTRIREEEEVIDQILVENQKFFIHHLLYLHHLHRFDAAVNFIISY